MGINLALQRIEVLVNMQYSAFRTLVQRYFPNAKRSQTGCYSVQVGGRSPWIFA
jgi:hypothetical protein